MHDHFWIIYGTYEDLKSKTTINNRIRGIAHIQCKVVISLYFTYERQVLNSKYAKQSLVRGKKLDLPELDKAMTCTMATFPEWKSSVLSKTKLGESF